MGVARTVTPPALGREETAAWKYLALALIPSPLLSPEQGCQHALLKPAHFLPSCLPLAWGTLASLSSSARAVTQRSFAILRRAVKGSVLP